MIAPTTVYQGGLITAYVKPTNFCNVGCSHCYLPEEVRANKFRMNDEVLIATANMLKDMATARRANGVHILWHGGEPLTLPPEWFEQAGAILDEILPGHSESIQTSLIPYRREFAPLIHTRFNSQIGTSIDFSQRTINGSNAQYSDLWMLKVNMAREEGIWVTPGTVPTKKDLGRGAEIVDWFVAREFAAFNLDRYNCYGETGSFPDYPNHAEHSAFLIEVFDRIFQLMETNGRAPIVNVIMAVLKGVLFGSPGDRWGTTCQSDFAVVEPDGSLNNCPDKASYEQPYSNALQGFDAFANSEGRRRAIRIHAIDHENQWCSSCENNSWCKTGCPITKNTPEQNGGECAGYKLFISHVRRFINNGGRDIAISYLKQD